MRLHLRLLAFVACSTWAYVSAAQPGERPKIGLALSGGGAKGLAHIGVLEVMEEVGLPPDYITGTSMGSLVGALYSIGYSTKDIREVVAEVDWDVVLANKISFERVTMEEKPYYGRYIAELPYENKKFNLPRGVIEGQELSMLFSRLTRSVHGVEDFHSFQIPFECVAADVTTGEIVVLDKGSLPDAMRASMSIPSIFTPVEIDDYYLVDGGLLRNFPVQNVIDMGADIVIGVYVSDDLSAKEDLNSLVDVLTQSAFIMSVFDSREQKELTNIYIEPNLKGYGTASFADADSIIQRGVVAGVSFRNQLQLLADSLNQWGTAKFPVKPEPEDKYLISTLDVSGNTVITDRIIAKKLRLPSSDSISLDAIEDRIRLSHGSGYLEKLNYRLIPGDNGHTLELKVKDGPKGKLKMAAHYDSENKAGININLTARNMLMKYSRALVELDLAENPRADFNYLKYVGKKLSGAFTIGGLLSGNDFPFYDADRKSALFNNGFQHYYVQFQSTTSNRYTLGVRGFYQHNLFRPEVVDETLNGINKLVNTSIGLQAFYKVNTMNTRFFPTKGIMLDLTYIHDFSGNNKLDITDISTGEQTVTENEADPFSSGLIDFSYNIPVNSRVSVLTRNVIWVSNLPSNSLNFGDYYFVGGFHPRLMNTTGYHGADLYEFPMNNVFVSKLGIQWELIRHLYLIGNINYADAKYPMIWVDKNLDTMQLGDRTARLGYSATFAYNSPLGPLQLSVGKDIHKDAYLVNLLLGFYF